MNAPAFITAPGAAAQHWTYEQQNAVSAFLVRNCSASMEKAWDMAATVLSDAGYQPPEPH